MMGREDAQNM